ncbi:hypothetical protein CNMCM8980_006520 [Aspergillus fumigatiaffinis]|uniref:Uncharacterized protein n=1 Tax=Aspergillus fumigatiaffinis TaxID=340414 RepID=A0A8H4M4E7_9EURO|nr:hypothetical protein CNMCM5878_006961 [Aspergillus fumigatiaffinis]KAF4229009.1 hypothetical protein CNMCM6457_006600 [Aspergillus fumigatiaffinis]KAF4236967.1 hypothetical protein CNMCM6805_007189 [Aspergillus fumigatiaffinis]KAF4248056.1 hypothetical protein CNMCM8980_006520 [Aspergillus fumigatiaffinis]
MHFTTLITTTLGLLTMVSATGSSASASPSPSSILAAPSTPISLHAPSHPARFIRRVLPSSTPVASASSMSSATPSAVF